MQHYKYLLGYQRKIRQYYYPRLMPNNAIYIHKYVFFFSKVISNFRTRYNGYFVIIIFIAINVP